VSGNSKKLTKCNPVAGAITTGITGYTNITSGDETALANAVYAQSAIAIGIDASIITFQFYQSGVCTASLHTPSPPHTQPHSKIISPHPAGIYNEKRCKNAINDLDHGVTLVGFGTGTTPPAPGPPTPPPAPTPAPGPDNCVDQHYKIPCEKEKGCNWCTDKFGLGYCFNQVCPPNSTAKDDPTNYWYVGSKIPKKSDPAFLKASN
jgi:hypothetical protein